MTSRNSLGNKKPIDSLYNLVYAIKHLSQNYERPLRTAFYNILVIAVVGAIIAVSVTLAPFFKPLLWAFLFGAVLYPSKRKISFGLKSWFEALEANNTHILVAITIAPFKGLEFLGEFFGLWLRQHIKILAGGVATLISIRILLSLKSNGIFCLIWRSVVWTHGLFTFALSSLNWIIVLVIVVFYASAIFLLWKPENASKFTIVGQTIWIIIIAYLCSFLGALQVPSYCLALSYGLVGIFYDIKSRSKSPSVQSTTFIQQLTSILDVKSFYNETTQKQINNEKPPLTLSIGTTSEAVARTKNELNVTDNSSKTNNKDSEMDYLQSDTYFKILFYACGATVFYNHLALLILLFFPIIFYIFIRFCTSFGIKQFLVDKICNVWNVFWYWVVERHSAIMPICLPGVLKLNSTIHLTIREYLKSSIDVVSSIIMIIILILTVIFASIFFCIQIYSETFAVAQLGSDLINKTLTARPDLMEMLPEGFQGSMDNIVDNAHQYGRTNIESYVNDLFKDTEEEQAKKLKNQILLVWDRFIQSWLDRSDNSIGPKTPASAISDTMNEIVDNPAAKQGITDWAKSNLGMIMDVMDSLWIIIRKNMYLLGSMFGTIFSVILGGGHVVITFIVSTIIFFTALFYLLSSSQERYAGLTAIDALGFSMGTKIAEALEDSISCVIIATVKMSLFHGLFTWLTHTWFSAHVVFLPAAIAASLAAAPFLGTYWCSVPAFLDLWLSQDRFYMGVLLFLIHFIIPSNFVDPTIIAEIKGGGHPYLTALSIAGGMFWLGLEGAVLGPLFLCLLVVIFDLTTTALRESPSFSRTPTDEKERIIADIRMS